MHTPVDARLLHEVERFALRFECEQCAHFEEESGRCAEGFPNEAHRAGRLVRSDQVVFCKRFELGA